LEKSTIVVGEKITHSSVVELLDGFEYEKPFVTVLNESEILIGIKLKDLSQPIIECFQYDPMKISVSQINDILDFVIVLPIVEFDTILDPTMIDSKFSTNKTNISNHLILHIVLLDEFNIIKTNRTVNLNEEISSCITQSILEEMSIANTDYEKTINDIYMNFSIHEILENAFIHIQ
jgi:hypothetical protein